MLNCWEKRSPEVAVLFNPAFTSSLICITLLEFKNNNQTGAPYILPYLVLPLILHTQTREKLPRDVRTNFSSWIMKPENTAIKIEFNERAKTLVPYVKDALLFALQNHRLTINQDGLIVTPNKDKFFSPKTTEEVKDCIRAAKLCGKWFSATNDLKTTMALLGVKP